jgi:gamma-butyrobetaine dioxygenase
MDPDEASAYEALPFYESSLVVRRWDDQAKDPNLATPPLAHYLPVLREVLTTSL